MISQGISIELDPTPPQSICDQPDSDPEAPSDEDEDMDNATMVDEGGEEEICTDDEELEGF